MEERLINQVVGQVMIYDNATKHWLPAGTSSGLSTVRLIHCTSNNTFKIHGQKIDGAKEVVLDNIITMDDKFNRANECFVRWHDKHAFWGLNFRPKPKGGLDEADSFFDSIKQILNIVNQTSGQNQTLQQHQQPQQSSLGGDSLSVSVQQPLQHQNSASIIQRPIQPQAQQQQISHQHAQQQVVQQTFLHQQQAQMMNMRLVNDPQHNQQPGANMLGQSAPAQLIQQQQLQQHQSNQPLLQQQHQAQYMQQHQPQSQQNQMNHYQLSHQQQVQQQVRQPPPQPQPQQQHQPQVQAPLQSAPVVAAPVPPPPPPPPPPAPPISGMLANRLNGTSGIITNQTMSSNGNNNNDAQHSPINNSNNLSVDRNGGSPSQVSSLANELAKCQLKKVNLSRSDSEKESECNNINMGNPKTTRAASLAAVPVNDLMNEMRKKLASRGERLDQKCESQSNSSTSGISNGICNDKGQESWLAELIRREINKEMTKMRAEILEAIRSELKQK